MISLFRLGYEKEKQKQVAKATRNAQIRTLKVSIRLQAHFVHHRAWTAVGQTARVEVGTRLHTRGIGQATRVDAEARRTLVGDNELALLGEEDQGAEEHDEDGDEEGELVEVLEGVLHHRREHLDAGGVLAELDDTGDAALCRGEQTQDDEVEHAFAY